MSRHSLVRSVNCTEAREPSRLSHFWAKYSFLEVVSRFWWYNINKRGHFSFSRESIDTLHGWWYIKAQLIDVIHTPRDSKLYWRVFVIKTILCRWYSRWEIRSWVVGWASSHHKLFKRLGERASFQYATPSVTALHDARVSRIIKIFS